MRIPKYWIRSTFDGLDEFGNPAEFIAWGWSSTSMEEARQRGYERAKSIFLRLSAGQLPNRSYPRTVEYDYLESPPREEIIESFGYAEDDSEAKNIITRNRYGALVLNSSQVLFVDIDRIPYRRPSSFFDQIRHAFSSKFREELELAHHLTYINRIVDWSQKNPSYGFRLYQTKAGYRLLFINKHFEPESEEVKQIFKQLGSDPLYQRLTERQLCFRARLTPKPWRIGLSRPTSYYPREKEQLSEYSSWLNQYKEKSKAYTTCAYLQHLGPTQIGSSIIEETIHRHDNACEATTAKPLA